MGKGLRFVMLNIRSLWPNIDEMRLNFYDFNVIGLCESWLTPAITDSMIDFPGFDLFRQDRCTNKRGGGLVIYVRKEYMEYCNVVDDLSGVTSDLEQLWVTFCMPNVRHMNIAVVYRPPGSNLENSINQLRTSLDKTTENTYENIVMGDLNINYKQRHSNPYKLLKEVERDFGLKQIIDKDTRIAARSSTLIDIILTDCRHVFGSGVLDMCISDHQAVYMVKKKTRLEYTRIENMCRSYKHYVKTEMQDSVEANLGRIEFWKHEKNIDTMWKILLGIIEDCANIHCPLVNMKIPDNSPIWFNREIVEEIRHKDYLYKEAKRLGTIESWNVFKCKKKELKTLLHKAKEEYIKEQIDTQQNNPRKFWRNLNTFSGLGKSCKKACLTKIGNDEGTILENQEAADFMNHYYVNAGPNLAKDFSNDWSTDKCKINVDSTFKFDFVTEDQISKLIKNIDIGKSSAVENLSSRILKDSFEVLIMELTQLYNECLTQGYCTKPLSTIQCNKTLCQDQLVPILLIG